MIRKLLGVIAIGLATYAANAESEVVDGVTWYYGVSDSSAYITYGENKYAGELTIPSTLGGYLVTSIGDYAFEDCELLISVTIPEGVTSIGYGAFENCTRLREITIPHNVVTFGGNMFEGCSDLSLSLSYNGTMVITKDMCVDGSWVIGSNGKRTTMDSTGTIYNEVIYKSSKLTPENWCQYANYATNEEWYLVDINSKWKRFEYSFFEEETIIDNSYVIGSNGKKTPMPNTGTTHIEICHWGMVGVASTEGVPVNLPGFYDLSAELKSRLFVEENLTNGCYVYLGETLGVDTNAVEVTIGEGAKTLPENIFDHCDKLQVLVILERIENITPSMMSRCKNLRTIYVPDKETARVILDGCPTVTNVILGDDTRQMPTPEPEPETFSPFDGSAKHTFNGLVYDSEDEMVGLIQIVTTKADKKGVSKVSGFVVLKDGKKQAIKSTAGVLKGDYLAVNVEIKGLGVAELLIGGDGFKGKIGNLAVVSSDVNEATGIVSATVKVQYFDAKTGKLKSRSVKLTGATMDGVSVGSITIKGQTDKSFVAEIE